jgi:hypothetical protein
VTVAAAELYDMQLPAPAKPIANPQVGEGSNDAVGYELADGTSVLVQHSVLDESCETAVDAEVAQAAVLAPVRVTIAGKPAAVATQDEAILVVTCHERELMIVTVLAKRSGAREASRAIAMRAAETIRPTRRAIETTHRVPIGPTLTIRLPAPLQSLESDAKYVYTFPGVKGLSVHELAPRSVADCAAWLDAQQRDLETPDDNLDIIHDRVDRVTVAGSAMVLGNGRQHARSGAIAGKWYTNIAAAYCSRGTPVLLFAISFEGATESGTPAATTARLRALLERIVATTELR